MLIAILNYLRPKKSPPPENLDVGRGQSIPRSPFSGTNWARIGQGWPKKPTERVQTSKAVKKTAMVVLKNSLFVIGGNNPATSNVGKLLIGKS
jgi:hypothetical protein